MFLLKNCEVPGRLECIKKVQQGFSGVDVALGYFRFTGIHTRCRGRLIQAKHGPCSATHQNHDVRSTIVFSGFGRKLDDTSADMQARLPHFVKIKDNNLIDGFRALRIDSNPMVVHEFLGILSAPPPNPSGFRSALSSGECFGPGRMETYCYVQRAAFG